MKKLVIFALLLFSFCVLPLYSYGSDFIIKGIITDSQTEKPLSNANISIEGTLIGTTSDISGHFKIQIALPGNYILLVNYIGYKTYRQSISLTFNKNIEIEIELIPTIIKGDGITVTAKADINKALNRETPVAFTKLDVIDLKSNYTTGDLPDLIQNVPGVWTSSAGMGESKIIVRGFSSDKVRFMVNDIPMNEPEDNQVYWSNWASLASTAQSIEVHRGPGYSLYGPAAFGGSVHIETMGVGLTPGTTFRASCGIYNRTGILEGNNKGNIYDTNTHGHLVDSENAMNYTYSLRFNSGPLYNSKLNLSAFLEYKTGDSYILGTTYDGYSLGLEAESILGRHALRFSFFVSPQVHNQAFALQDIDLLKTIGREFNRKNHYYQENYYTKPFFSLKHEWNISNNHLLVNSAYFTFGKGADQMLVNDSLDVSTGNVYFTPVRYARTLYAFGLHATYLYENYRLWSTDFQPIDYGCPLFLRDGTWQHYFKGHGLGGEALWNDGINFFTTNHDHSWQRRDRRDHDQFGLCSYYQYEFNDKLRITAGAEGRIWRGHRESELWYLRFSQGINFHGTFLYPVVENALQSNKLQSLYNYDTEVNNFSIFSRFNFRPFNKLVIQAGGQAGKSYMKVIENPIKFLDFGSFKYFDDSFRTSMDLYNADSTQKRFTEADYKRTFSFYSPWAGCNYNLNDEVNIFANIATSHKEPAILDWYDWADGPYVEREKGSKIQPEIAVSYEAGLGYNLLFGNAKLNYYFTTYKNKIETTIDINDRRNTLNAGDAVYQGLELQYEGNFQDFDFAGSATFARNRWQKMSVDSVFGASAKDVINKVVPFAPEKMFTASFGYRFEPYPSHFYHLKFRLNYWDDYYGTYTNAYMKSDGSIASAKLPYFLDLSAQLSLTKKMQKVDLIFRIDVNNILNRRDNYMRAQYTIDYTRNDDLAGKYHWYVLQAPLFNIFLTSEVAIH